MKTIRSYSAKDAGLAGEVHGFSSPLGAFFVAALSGGVVLLLVSILMIGSATSAVVIGLATYLMATVLVARSLAADFPHAALGLCNIATLGRLVIVGILLTALLHGLAPTWATFGLAVIALCLDGVDGWLARKQGLVSDFGARFDVEVDAAFALVLAIFAAVNGAAGMYVMLLGLPYYVFGAARLAWPWLGHALPDSFARKVVCVFQIAALIALQVPFLADGRLDLVILAVTVALFWSFGRDILWLWRHAR
ncbi:CDP-alcohol phosphatidyltransferase family protein [Cognatiyoonia sp. IB215446]|uniref:CDP-alcohol phosphatidyltransferase family protein n=1 Tax=Cognatiyoonia sp. IB215446 TaxID=3097355 RepID=UPI002A154581|nr:CDP-alcohol phosphatidyltransferase family protein [Cognatiyoonia sp. IB215446]MDX8349418.1 CDP-alcohol phosphatidyltransferase family protein [Cognatiyoonia sp. IB215446]